MNHAVEGVRVGRVSVCVHDRVPSELERCTQLLSETRPVAEQQPSPRCFSGCRNGRGLPVDAEKQVAVVAVRGGAVWLLRRCDPMTFALPCVGWKVDPLRVVGEELRPGDRVALDVERSERLEERRKSVERRIARRLRESNKRRAGSWHLPRTRLRARPCRSR